MKAAVANHVAEELMSLDQIKAELQKAESLSNKKEKIDRLLHVIHHTFLKKEWDLALQAILSIPDERKRNLMLADLIEEHLLPHHELKRAKESVKYLTPQPETKQLVLVQIALADDQKDHALQLAEQLPTPQSRNYALWHIAEAYLMDNQREKAIEIGERMVENAKTISNHEHRSYSLRDIIKNLYLENGAIDKAKQVLALITEEPIKKKLMTQIEKRQSH